jgi:hypothetical protein
MSRLRIPESDAPALVVAVTASMRSDEHRASHDRIPSALHDVIRLERLGHLHTYEVVAE